MTRVITPREAAFLTLKRVWAGEFPDEALENLAQGLDRRDRALASALVYGVLRQRSRLDWTLHRFLTRPGKKLDEDALIALELGLYQLAFMDKIPASAAVDESVKLVRKFCRPHLVGLVNAVLRSVTRAEALPDPEQEDLPPAERLALAWSHPQWMVQRWLDQFGLEETKALLEANNRQAPLTIRVNHKRISREELKKKLQEAGFSVRETVFSPVGLAVLDPAGPPSELPGFDQGLFAVQDEAAQMVGLLARPAPGDKVLDACAGRGGKTMHLAEQVEAPVRALDRDPGRIQMIAAEARRMGLPVPEPVLGDLTKAAPFQPESFDLVVVDAPCSNLGVIRRRPDVKWLKSEVDIPRLAALQTELLNAASDLVRPGGRLVYAVCTTTWEETLGVTDAFWMTHLEFGLKPVSLYLPESAAPLADPDGVMRIRPDRHDADGFFAAVFERKVKKPPDFPLDF